jgi:uncharacterized membrane protein YgdD (TMEM256/DUF423 family)
MHTTFLKIASVFGVLSVGLGAFAAHALKGHIADYALSIFETGVRYQFYHVFALFVTGILYKEFSNKFIRWTGILFITGIILFSGSLYFLTYIKGVALPGYSWVGAITPIGGLAFILGWIFLFIGCSDKKLKTISNGSK